jgi:hypothetical protein
MQHTLPNRRFLDSSFPQQEAIKSAVPYLTKTHAFYMKASTFSNKAHDFNMNAHVFIINAYDSIIESHVYKSIAHAFTIQACAFFQNPAPFTRHFTSFGGKMPGYPVA